MCVTSSLERKKGLADTAIHFRSSRTPHSQPAAAVAVASSRLSVVLVRSTKDVAATQVTAESTDVIACIKKFPKSQRGTIKRLLDFWIRSWRRRRHYPTSRSILQHLVRTHFWAASGIPSGSRRCPCRQRTGRLNPSAVTCASHADAARWCRLLSERENYEES